MSALFVFMYTGKHIQEASSSEATPKPSSVQIFASDFASLWSCALLCSYNGQAKQQAVARHYMHAHVSMSPM